MTDAHVKQVYSVVAEVTDDIQLPYNEFSIASTSAVQHYRAQHRETEASRPPCLSCLVNTLDGVIISVQTLRVDPRILALGVGNYRERSTLPRALLTGVRTQRILSLWKLYCR